MKSLKHLDLVRDVLDIQVIDREGTKMGRVDGIVLELREGQPPRVEAIEMGFVVLAKRLHPRLEDWLMRLRRRFSVRRTACHRVPWSQVEKVDVFCVQLDVEAENTPAFDWERWLRNHVIAHFPGVAK
jgi:sporulation protein YlmC with PRC-barrel domain